jgi:hypothetical protein
MVFVICLLLAVVIQAFRTISSDVNGMLCVRIQTALGFAFGPPVAFYQGASRPKQDKKNSQTR